MRTSPAAIAATLLLAACGEDLPADPVSPGAIRLGLEGGPACLEISPATIEFERGGANCGTGEATVLVTNGCDEAVTLERVTLDGDAFVLLAEPPRPTTVPSGWALPIVVGYRPQETGEHAGELRLAFADFEAPPILLAGTTREQEWITDTFVHTPRPKVDLLFVIDNGVNMAEAEANLANNLRPFLSYAQAMEIDFHIGVTTTGLAPDGDCPGGVGGGEDGRLVPVSGERPRIITPETPDMERVWAENFRVGACREGENQVFEAALRALTAPLADATDDPRHPESDDGNAGFLRPDAHLSILAITNRPDTSPDTTTHYFQKFQELKGPKNPHLFNFHAITGDVYTGCVENGGAGVGDRLVSVVEKTDGGIFQSICASDWSVSLRPMGPGFGGFQTCFFLSEQPVDLDADGVISDTTGELEVRMNGQVVPSRGAQNQQIWSYSDQQAVCFNPLAVPEPGSAIEIHYLPACS